MAHKALVLKNNHESQDDTRPIMMNGRKVREFRRNKFGWSRAEAAARARVEGTMEDTMNIERSPRTEAAAKAGIDERTWTKVEEKGGPVQLKLAHAIANALGGKLEDTASS